MRRTHEVAERHEETNLANVCIHVAEPVPELLVLLRILVQVVHGIANDVHAHTIREPFEKGAKLAHCLAERLIVRQLLVRVLALRSRGTSVRGILLKEVEKPPDRLLVVLVLLALDDDFLAAVDELVTTLLREVFLQQNLLGTIVVLIGTVLVLLRNSVG